MRQQSPRLVLAISFLIVVTTTVMTIRWSSDNVVFAGRVPGYSPVIAGDYQGPQCCRECHQAEFAAWSQSNHAQAIVDPVFQINMQKADKPADCFACHTTGYDADTGRFLLAGITCEACHGPFRAGHPDEYMVIPVSPDRCGDCHTDHLIDWQAGDHGGPDQSCIDCHQVHSWSPPTL